ncbi:50S ribosomal protein L11 methyltransferase [Pseudochrobactrum sp. HB0163]|uniref:50S ribosomal protein L11 methyltransferase n=1 Tax=Pseudochrobactrum sp. HB0163 TaxID=3450708 RepID=UPI003F6DAEF6
MAQYRLYLTRDKDQAERIFDLLEPVFEEDGLPLANTEIDEDKQIYEVSLYTQDKAGADNALPRMAACLGLQPQDISIEELPDIDWVLHSLEGLKPVRAGHFFVHGSHDRDKLQNGDIGIEIDAGLAFGTGHHGTTAACLEMIEEIVEREEPQNVLDLGTGSAVLAIAVTRMRDISVLATDIDPVAVDVAQENVVKNGADKWVSTLTATGFDHPQMQARAPFDLIIANILANPLIELAAEMRAHVADHGSLILSGILETQRDSVLQAYQAVGLEHHKTTCKESWVALHLKPKL